MLINNLNLKKELQLRLHKKYSNIMKLDKI